MNSGGEDSSSSTNFRLRDTVGEQGTGLSGSANYQMSAGYRAGETLEPFIALTLGTQENQTRKTWTAFSNAGKTVTLTSTSTLAVGNFIGVIENSGPSQLVAFGKITDITGAIVTVDAWDGEPASLSASPTGGNDFAYRLNGSTAALGVQTSASVATSLTVTSVLSNALNGYRVTVQAGDDLKNPSGAFIANVSDGAVTAGSEEYGGEFVGSTATSTGSDFSFTSTTERDIQQSVGFGDNSRVGVIYKLSITNSTPSGNYSQTLYYRLTGNF